MKRLAFFLAVVLLTTAAVPIVAHQEGSSDVCPLAHRTAPAAVCIAAACPCHHGPDRLLTSPTAREPERGPGLFASPAPVDVPAPGTDHDTEGFPGSIDHPPDPPR